MTIDTKRLATDAAYWDEVAPNGAEEYGVKNDYFYKRSHGVWMYWKVGHNKHWLACSMRKPLVIERIPRPTTPAAPEWDGEGLPPVGCECEVYPYFEKCRICCEYDGGVVFHNLHDDGFFYAKNDGRYRFRPILTAEQRQRKELKEVIKSAYLGGASTHIGGIEASVDAILSRYNLEPKA